MDLDQHYATLTIFSGRTDFKKNFFLSGGCFVTCEITLTEDTWKSEAELKVHQELRAPDISLTWERL